MNNINIQLLMMIFPKKKIVPVMNSETIFYTGEYVIPKRRTAFIPKKIDGEELGKNLFHGSLVFGVLTFLTIVLTNSAK